MMLISIFPKLLYVVTFLCREGHLEVQVLLEVILLCSVAWLPCVCERERERKIVRERQGQKDSERKTDREREEDRERKTERKDVCDREEENRV